jgi:hypothetical protein
VDSIKIMNTWTDHFPLSHDLFLIFYQRLTAATCLVAGIVGIFLTTDGH